MTDAWHDGFLGGKAFHSLKLIWSTDTEIECLNAGPEYCALAKPHGGQPVALKDLQQRLDLLVKSLITHPISGYTEESGPSLITYARLTGAIYGSMYNAQSWPALAEMLYELEAGNSSLAAGYLEAGTWEYDPTRPQSLLHRPSTDELGSLVICGDGYDAPMPPEGLAWWSSLWANMTSKSWISGNSRFHNVFPCRHFTTYWPDVAEVFRGDLNQTLKHPVLLIAETYDPATPLRNGRRLLAEMGDNARLIAHHGYGHSSRDKSNCTESIAKAYILNGTVPEDSETACYADKKPYVKDPHTESLTETWDPVKDWKEHIEMMATWFPSR